MKQMVKHYVQTSHNTWDRYLFCLRMAYNFTEHATTGYTPFRLFFSRVSDPDVPLDLVYGRVKPHQEPRCYNEYVMEQSVKSAKVLDIARQHIKKQVSSQVEYHDAKGIKSMTYVLGQLVLREYPPLANQKLGPKYHGPWVVIGMVDSHVVEICRGGSPIQVHINCLKPYKVQTNDGVREMASAEQLEMFMNMTKDPQEDAVKSVGPE